MKVKLSDRIRPNSEAAPWVVEEIKKLEAQLLIARLALDEIASYDKDSKHGNGICPYGCDTPHIAQDAIKNLNGQKL